MAPKVSVIIPAFNAQETLEDCLSAVCNQQDHRVGEDYEILVIDDGSTDGTSEIAGRYPVKLIRHAENLGRLAARRKGALSAQADLLLFVDTRVIVSQDLLVSYFRLGLSPCYAGELGEEENARRNEVDRLFFRLRRLYYRPYYPQRVPVLELTRYNFFKVPKGTGCLFIDKGSFLRALPGDIGREVNDDSKLFHHIVFEEGRPLYRCKDLRIEYRQRREEAKIMPWIRGRGLLLADYLLTKRPVFLIAYVLSLALCVALIGALAIAPRLVLMAMASGLFLYSLGIAWLARNRRDFVAFFPIVLKLGWNFWLGIHQGVGIRLGKALGLRAASSKE